MSDEKRDARTVAAAIYQAVAESASIPVTLEIIPTNPADLPAAMVRMLPTKQPIVKRYGCGDWVGRQLWGICYRVDARDNAQRTEAVAVLQALADDAESLIPLLPEGIEFQGTEASDMPALIDATNDYETWQVTFATEFKRRRAR